MFRSNQIKSDRSQQGDEESIEQSQATANSEQNKIANNVQAQGHGEDANGNKGNLLQHGPIEIGKVCQRARDESTDQREDADAHDQKLSLILGVDVFGVLVQMAEGDKVPEQADRYGHEPIAVQSILPQFIQQEKILFARRFVAGRSWSSACTCLWYGLFECQRTGDKQHHE